jgi:hypothetical protein
MQEISTSIEVALAKLTTRQQQPTSCCFVMFSDLSLNKPATCAFHILDDFINDMGAKGAYSFFSSDSAWSRFHL